MVRVILGCVLLGALVTWFAVLFTAGGDRMKKAFWLLFEKVILVREI
jgi:hypothetical protein